MKKLIAAFSTLIIICGIALCCNSVYAMTQQEVDQYNNLYYPQSVYNGGINTGVQENDQSAYVDPATGSTHVGVTDLSLPGRNGFDLNITRTYNSNNASMFEAYLKETERQVQRAYYMVRGTKIDYKEYLNGNYVSTPTNNVCISPLYLTYLDTKTEVWMMKNASNFEFTSTTTPAKSKVFSSYSDAAELADLLNSENPDLYAYFPYDNVLNWEINYSNYTVVTVMLYDTVTDYTDGLLDDTATERYSKLGTGWEFNFPYVETRYGYDDNYEYLHFGDKGTYLIDFGTDGGDNNLAGYPLNDIILTNNTTITHDGMRSKYLATEKNGTKYYFGTDGRLLYEEDRYGNQIKFYCDTEVYTNVWGSNKSYPFVERIVDTIGREIVFTQTNETNGDKYLYMTITDPNDSANTKQFEYYMDKLTSSEIGITGFDECDDLECDEWVLKTVFDSCGKSYRYNYNYYKTKFSFLDRNSTFYYDNYDYTDSAKGNSYILTNSSDSSEDNYFENISGIHNSYALLRSETRVGEKCYYFSYSPFLKNCTPNGSMMFYKAYQSYEESAEDYEQNSYYLNEKAYQYDINGVGEYDGYIGYRRDDRIGSSYNYAVKVTDKNLPTNKYSYDIYKYTYIGASSDKTILLTKFTDKGTEHNVITDYSYDQSTRLLTGRSTKKYSVSSPSVYMTESEAYTYNSYGDLLTQTPNATPDRAVTYTYNSLYHFPVSKTYKQDAATTISEEYTTTSNGKSIEYVNLYVNGAVKSKTQYSHDSYGNITNKKVYLDNMTDYIETSYVYSDGVYVTSETAKNVKDNNNISSDVSVTASYDCWGNMITQTDAKGNTTAYTYDEINRLTGITAPDGSTKAYYYGSWNIRETDELGNKVNTYYTAAKDIENIYYQSLGADHNYCYYDPFGNLKTEVIYSADVNEEGEQIPESITQFTYDTMQRPTTKKIYDRNNNLIYQEDYSYELTNTYEKQTVTVLGDTNTPSIVTSQYTDMFGNKIKKEIGTDTETYTTDYVGNILTVKSAKANAENWVESYTNAFEYDFRGNITKGTNVLGNFTRAEYDSLGRKIKAYDENGYAVWYKYDELNRLVEQKTPVEAVDGTIYYSIKKMWYDNNGNLSKEQINTNSSGETASYSEVIYNYDSKNKLISTISGDGNNSYYTQNYYDAKGNLLRVYTGLSSPLTINGLDDVTPGADTEYAVQKYSYDALSRVPSSTDALNRTETNVYDASTGLVRSQTDRNGTSFCFGYSGLGKLTSKSLSDNTNTETKIYGMTGNIVSAQNANGTISYIYNNKGLLVSEIDSALGTTKSITYDADGNRLSFVLSRNGQTEQSLSYTYDKLNRLTSVSENGNIIASYSYDIKNNRTQTAIPGGDTTNYTYNLANLLTSQQTGNKLSEQYTYYLNGNQKSKTSNGVTTNYNYDKMNRLTVENETTYTFDDFGNRITMSNDDVGTSYQYDLNNRLIKSIEMTGETLKQTSFFYDYNGNQITKAVKIGHSHEEGTTGDYTLSDISNENISLYEYDCYNQLVGVDTNGIQSSYTYASDGLRQSKTVDGNTITFVYDNANVIEEIGAVETNKYYRGFEIIKNDDNLFYIYNGQSDVSFIENADGSIAASYIFDAYGNQSEENTVYNPFGYRGEYTDSETNLVFLRARMYDPKTGRFINEDPIKYGLNWYVYADNNPILYVDPSGNNPVAAAEAFLESPIGQQMYQSIANLANQAGVSITNYVVQNFPQIQQAANYISEYGAAAWDWSTNTAAPWVAEKAQQAGKAISDTAEKAGNWVKEKWNNATNGDPNKKPDKKSNNSGGMNNKRILDTTKIKGYNVSLDLEKGGSGLNNIHIKVDNTKYFYNDTVQAFTDTAGNRLPKSLQGNQDIINAFNKAKNLINQGW